MATTKTAAPAAKSAKAAPAKDPNVITGYCVQTKEKDVQILNPVINIKSGRYIAQGKSAAGFSMASIMSKATAENFIKIKAAKKGEGWN